MKLREYQLEIKQKILSAWENGAKNVLVQLSTGAGKTVIFCNILSEHQGHAIAIAHRIELVSQISLTLAMHGIYHNIIAQKSSIRSIVSLHMQVLKKSYFQPLSKITVAGVDTLIKLKHTTWMDKITLVVQDEAHHVLQSNKWGTAAALFKNAKGLYPSATPVRADGYGLGIHADGIIDALIIGPSMQELITQGHLTDYTIYAPPSDLDLSQVTLSASGDYSPPKLRSAVNKSHITGDVVEHYLKIAKGKQGVTFAVSIENAIEISKQFNAAGIKSEVISSKTDDLVRHHIMQKFKNKEILQLVNVDLLGEGVDVPVIEVISMARPTHSYAVYAQQFGRALRPMTGKDKAIIIDHVGNVYRHNLPDLKNDWSLNRREKKFKADKVIESLKTCTKCFKVYQRINRVCPYCGYYSLPASRSLPEYVDGDLLELNIDALKNLQSKVEQPKIIPQGLPVAAQRALMKNYTQLSHELTTLKESIALWAGYKKQAGLDDSQIYRNFYLNFGMDVLTAQTLTLQNTIELNSKINRELQLWK